MEAEGAPASPFSVTYKISEPQADEGAARRILQTFRREPVAVKESDWIAVSQVGVQNLRAIEIVIVAPASCSARAEQLAADVAARIRRMETGRVPAPFSTRPRNAELRMRRCHRASVVI